MNRSNLVVMFASLLFGLIGLVLILFNRWISSAIVYHLPSWMIVEIPGINTRERILIVGVLFVLLSAFFFVEWWI